MKRNKNGKSLNRMKTHITKSVKMCGCRGVPTLPPDAARAAQSLVHRAMKALRPFLRQEMRPDSLRQRAPPFDGPFDLTLFISHIQPQFGLLLFHFFRFCFFTLFFFSLCFLFFFCFFTPFVSFFLLFFPFPFLRLDVFIFYFFNLFLIFLVCYFSFFLVPFFFFFSCICFLYCFPFYYLP